MSTPLGATHDSRPHLTDAPQRTVDPRYPRQIGVPNVPRDVQVHNAFLIVAIVVMIAFMIIFMAHVVTVVSIMEVFVWVCEVSIVPESRG